MSHNIIIDPTVKEETLISLVSELNTLDKIRSDYTKCSDGYILTIAKLKYCCVTDNLNISIGIIVGNHVNAEDIVDITKISNKSARDTVATFMELLSNTEPQ